MDVVITNKSALPISIIDVLNDNLIFNSNTKTGKLYKITTELPYETNKNGVLNLTDFNLPSIDRNATKKAVESALEKYRILLLRQFDNQPKITQTYSIIPPSNTNKFHSSTEDAAIKKVDLEREMQQYLNRMIHAVNRITHWERPIIIKRYMNDEDVFDYEIYNDIGMSERKYYRVKARAFYKLAFLLKIKVYEEQGVTA